MLSHNRWLWFFLGGRLRVPTRRCNLVVPADWGGGVLTSYTDRSMTRNGKSMAYRGQRIGFASSMPMLVTDLETLCFFSSTNC